RQVRGRMAGMMIAALLFVAAMWDGFSTRPPDPPDDGLRTRPTYEVYAVEYAVIPDFPVAGLVEGADTDRKLDIAMRVWVVRGGGQTIVSESGIDRPE